MNKPDPNCSQCDGKGFCPAIALDIHGDGRHDCFCVHEDGPLEPEKMAQEELICEIHDWRTGRLYRGYDRIKALEHEKCAEKLREAWKAGALAGAAAMQEGYEADADEDFQVLSLTPESIVASLSPDGKAEL